MALLLFLFIASSSAASYKPVPPIKCGVNEYAVPCKTICPPQSCDNAFTEYSCDPIPKCIPGCDCIKNYLRNTEQICIFNENCRRLSTQPENTTYVPPEPTKIPPKSNPSATSKSTSSSSASSSSSSSGSSSSSQSSASSSTSSLSSNNGTAGITCGENEYAVPCKILCPPQECKAAYTTYSCDPDPKCIPGCDCIENHLRDENQKCILNDDCLVQPEQVDAPQPEEGSA